MDIKNLCERCVKKQKYTWKKGNVVIIYKYIKSEYKIN